MTGALAALFRRETRLALRVGGGAMMGAVFFLILVSLMPFAVGPDLNLLQRVGPAILWVGALLATLLGLDRLFQADHEDGSLDLLVMAETPLVLTVAVKGLAHWLTTGLPLVLVAPLLGLMLNIAPGALLAVSLTLLIGTPALTFIGTIGAALTVALRRGGLLVPVLVLPLAVPVLIFGVGATSAAVTGPMAMTTPLMVLAGISLASLVLAPVAAAAALRLALE
jgi:heme exporter protein B